jgi:hypothetical protein
MSNVTFSDIRRRQGEFTIKRELIEQSPANIIRLLTGMLIVRAEYMWDSNSIKYTAMSMEFDSLEEGQVAPVYLCQVTMGGDESTAEPYLGNISWNRL